MHEYKKYAIYARTALANSDSQDRLQEQIRTALAYLDSIRSDTVARVYVDNGISGATIQRPALRTLLTDAAKGEFDIVFCASEDRLGRSETYELIRDELTHLGVDVIPVDRASAFLTHTMMQDLLMA